MNTSGFLALLQLQLRLVRKKLLLLSAITLLLAILSGVLAFIGGLFFANEEALHVTVAIAVEDGDERLHSALQMVSDVREVAAFASLLEATPENAAELVRDGKATAAVVFPRQFISNVIAGIYTPPRLIIDTSRSIETILITKLMESGVRLLTASQQGYAFTLHVYDAFSPAEPPREVADSEISMRFVLFVASCGELFQRLTLSSTGTLSFAQHLLLSGALLFTALSLPVLYPLFSFRAQRGFLLRLNAGGFSKTHYILAQIIAGACAMLFLLLLLFTLAAVTLGRLLYLPAILPAMLLSALFFSCYGFLLSNLSGMTGMAAWNFLCSVLMVLSFGGLIPSAYLPAPLRALGAFSPMKYMHAAFSVFFQAPVPSFMPLAASAAVLLGLCVLLGRLKREEAPA